jgi:glycosyltransferase involved in cell wall biosynthesis
MTERRILVLTYYYPPDRSVGSHRWAALAPQLRALGHDVRVLTTSLFGSLPDDPGRVRRTHDLQSDGPLRRWLGRPPTRAGEAAGESGVAPAPRYLTHGLVPDAHVVTWLPFAIAGARRTLARWPADAIVTNSPTDSTHLAPLLLGSARPAWIADFEDGWRFEPLRGEWPTRAQARLDDALERRVVRSVDMITAVTQPIVDDFAARYGAPAHHVPLGWDPDQPVAAEPPPGALEPGTVTLLHPGTLSLQERRDPRGFFRGLERFAARDPEAGRLRVVLAGPRTSLDDELLAALEPAARNLVRHVGRLPRADVLALEHAADALLLLTTGPHRSVATGKVYEYFGAGRPVLALCPDNEARRIVEETRVGPVLDPDAHDAIADALGRTVRGTLLDGIGPPDFARYVMPRPALAFAEAVEEAVERRAAARPRTRLRRG